DLVRAVKDRSRNIETEGCRCKTQMDLQHLSDIHTGRYAQRVQHDIQRTSVRQERHIFHRKHTGNDTLVTVTSRHLVADRDFSLLSDVDADCLVDTRRQLIAVLSGKYFGLYYDTVLTVRSAERRVGKEWIR